MVVVFVSQLGLIRNTCIGSNGSFQFEGKIMKSQFLVPFDLGHVAERRPHLGSAASYLLPPRALPNLVGQESGWNTAALWTGWHCCPSAPGPQWLPAPAHEQSPWTGHRVCSEGPPMQTLSLVGGFQ